MIYEYKPIFVFPSVMKVLFRESTISTVLFLSLVQFAALYSLHSQLLYKKVWPPGYEHISQMVSLGKQTYFQFIISFSVRAIFPFGKDSRREGETYSLKWGAAGTGKTLLDA